MSLFLSCTIYLLHNESSHGNHLKSFTFPLSCISIRFPGLDFVQACCHQSLSCVPARHSPLHVYVHMLDCIWNSNCNWSFLILFHLCSCYFGWRYNISTFIFNCSLDLDFSNHLKWRKAETGWYFVCHYIAYIHFWLLYS